MYFLIGFLSVHTCLYLIENLKETTNKNNKDRIAYLVKISSIVSDIGRKLKDDQICAVIM